MSAKVISIDAIDERVAVAELDASADALNASLQSLSDAHPNLFVIGWVAPGSVGNLAVTGSRELQGDVYRQDAAEAARVLARMIDTLPPPLRAAFEDELQAIQAARRNC